MQKEVEVFLGYTVGVECWVNDRIILVRCEYLQLLEGTLIRAVSGRTLSALKGVKSAHVSDSEFEDRPRGAYQKVEEAIWALDKLGLKISAVDC